MADVLYEISWGAVRLWAARVSTDNSRTQVVHELATGDEHPVSDRGLAPRTTTCELLFDDFPGESRSPLERFLLFKRQVDDGAEEVFTHPIDGGYFAKVSEFTYDLDDDGNIVNASATFIANQPIAATLQPGLAPTSPAAGLDAVAARADALNAELESVFIETTFPDRAQEVVAAWSGAEGVPTRDVIVQTADLSTELAELTETLEADLSLWEAYKAAILLGDAIRAAAIAATRSSPRLFFVRIVAPISLLAFATATYGGAEAEERAQQIRDLNDLRTPGGMIEAGTELVIPAPSLSRLRGA